MLQYRLDEQNWHMLAHESSTIWPARWSPSWRTLAEALGHGLQMEAKVAQYVFNGVEESLNHSMMILSCDKACPAKMTTSNAVISYPNNVAVSMCPVVST